MKHMKKIFFFLLMAGSFSCTKLEESFNSEISQNDLSSITAEGLLTSTYNSFATYQDGNFWHLQEHTSDEAIAPTRGPDWDDNGQWRALHAHTWNADHGQISGAFSDLLSAQFNASNVLQFNPSAQQGAEARFLRALTVFSVVDGWNQVPYREDLTDYRLDPVTLKGTEATDFIISELNAIMNDLPDNVPAYTASKNAAKVLLMKTYLNKGVFKDDRANPTFDPADMNQVITLADEIIGSGKYVLSAAGKYFDNFAPANNTISKENIFTFFNENGIRGSDIRNAWYQIAHYNMDPGGWNGFATLSDFYDKFEASDERRGIDYNYPGALPNPGNRQNVGLLFGQQYNLTTDAPLKDRQGVNLAFTREVSLRETGSNLEMTGIRAIKYPYDYATSGDQKNNDWAYFRYADVLLMKAEALLRTDRAADGLAIVNSLRSTRGATALASLTEANLLDERGREFYWEGWRRQDLVRFGKYNDAWQEKTADDPKNLLFPIPANQLAVNPNLTQNPGY